MSLLNKIPLDINDVTFFLEDEKSFLIGLINRLEEIDEEKINKKYIEIFNQFKAGLIAEVDKIYPSKDPQDQIQALFELAKIHTYKS